MNFSTARFSILSLTFLSSIHVSEQTRFDPNLESNRFDKFLLEPSVARDKEYLDFCNELRFASRAISFLDIQSCLTADFCLFSRFIMSWWPKIIAENNARAFLNDILGAKCLFSAYSRHKKDALNSKSQKFWIFCYLQGSKFWSKFDRNSIISFW